MLALLQRINGGKVVVDGKTVAECEGKGLLVLLGVTHDDDRTDAELLAEKLVKLRIFPDENDKMNLSVNDVGGGIIVVSQFTLYASYRKGNRPDYMNSARPEVAEPLYEYFIECVKERNPNVSHGIFGADMKVSLLNDGPVTMQLDSAVLRGPKREKNEL